MNFAPGPVCLLRNGERTGGTLSRELVGVSLFCSDSDLRTREADKRRLEWEANDFATELLMPRRLFAGDVANVDASCKTIAVLTSAEMYDVSFTAAAWRLTETTRESCALVVSTDGVIE